jgi:hypothetical protein
MSPDHGSVSLREDTIATPKAHDHPAIAAGTRAGREELAARVAEARRKVAATRYRAEPGDLCAGTRMPGPTVSRRPALVDERAFLIACLFSLPLNSDLD